MSADKPEMKLARSIANGVMIAVVVMTLAVLMAVIYAVAYGGDAIVVPIAVIFFVLGLIIGFASGSKLKEYAFRLAARDVGRKYEFRERR
jgi:L-aminopeptidase/D-esterase-like protein